MVGFSAALINEVSQGFFATMTDVKVTQYGLYAVG